MLRPVHQRRPAFTLVELLVVMAIIALLASLLLVGIQAARNKGYDVADVNDMKQLENALNEFKGKYKVYPPSLIVLMPNRSDYNLANPLHKESLFFINKRWPSIGDFTNVNWSGVAPNPLFTGVTLTGDQCVVFFLGGINGIEGFSTNPRNPAQDSPVNPTDRPKSFNFPANRLKGRVSGIATDPFPSFYDNYAQQPYLYFAPGSTGLYNLPLSGTPTPSHTITINYTDSLTPVSDDVSPYFDGSSSRPNPYWNPTTFQIITAGYDGRFGPLGDWRNGTSPAAGVFWKDNRANFSTHILGVQP